ncbi:hypothetical protein MBRA1_003237 [Malassezia brasiliensis]|uniref:Uncharacterized protein n=1 Tax=Malassezia brasiliensis TaxID=1821822 RepID=A0AAF0DVK9_9BASI|nr:hypothetical protein MBRA1_003237 [Malassezia brasiliensis]
MAPEASRRGHRVLIAAFVLPHTVEFLAEDPRGGDDVKLQLPAPTSPDPRPANTQQLADMLSSRLQVAATQQQENRGSHARSRVGHHFGSSPGSRHSSFVQRERVNMAELMAEAAGGGGTAYLQPHSGSAIASGPPSPALPDFNEATTGGAALAQPTKSDHGRRTSAHQPPATQNSSGATSGEPATRGASSRRDSGGALPPFFKPLQAMPAAGSPHTDAGRMPAPHLRRDAKTTTPASIISDLATKQHPSASATPAFQEQNPFGAGSVTPAPPGQVGRGHPTPLLIDRPELASGWSGAPDGEDAALRAVPEHPVLRRGRAESPARTSSAPAQAAEGAVEPTPAPGAHDEGVLPVTEEPEGVPVSDAHDKEAAHARRGRLYRVDSVSETTASGTMQGRGSQLRRASLRGHPKRSSSSSHVPPIEDEDGKRPYVFVPNPGANYGLINAVNSVGDDLFPSGKLYIGTLGIEMDWVPTPLRHDIDARARAERECVPVWLKDKDYVNSYHHYCKQILWPTFHYTLPNAQGLASEDRAFRAYVEVNRRFAERIVEVYEEGDVVWVQDYHLLLVPHMVRERLPRASIGLFVHIAFPSSEIFRCLSTREELLRGMLGADLIGFQTHNFCRHFRQTISRILQLETTPRGIQLRRAFVTVAPFPIGIDVHSLNSKREHPDVHEWVERLNERFAGKHVIVGRDKLDWIKGVRAKLLAFEVFLDEHPEWVGRVVLIQVALATVQENHEVGEATDIVARINRKHSSLTYQPVVFLHVQELTFSQYLALLTMADVFLATSLREGMNLTSHEYVIAQEARKRPLILSEFTGTYAALRACIGINPWNTRQVSSAIHQALTMPEKEMEQRWYDLHRTVVTQTAQHWITSVLSQLERAHQRQPSVDKVFIPRLEIAQLASEWRASRSRLVLVDLEGTLVEEDAAHLHRHGFHPTPRLVDLLQRLATDTRNYVYVLSGQSTHTLQHLAAEAPQVGIIAENGCYVQHCNQRAWHSLVDGFNLEWRTPVLEILDYFTERTPGSWVEEHHASVTWHFGERLRDSTAAERQWARRQAAEVQSLIYDSLGERFSLRILHGHACFTIMPKNVSRTTAVQYLLSLDGMGALPTRHADEQAETDETQKGMFTFVLQIGTDEHLVAYLNQLDLGFAPRTCIASESARPSSDASYHLAPGADVQAALEEIVDLRLRDLKWGGPATHDV